MSELIGIERFIETEGIDKGRIKDIGVAWEVALTDDAWRDENNGQPMLSPPERVGKQPVYYSELIEQEIARIITTKVVDEITNGLKTIHEETHDETTDPENQSEAWFSWKIANRLFSSLGEERGFDSFDYYTCNIIAAMPFPEAFETAYSYLTQAGQDADEVLCNFVEKSTDW